MMWLRGDIETRHPIVRALTYRSEFRTLAQLRESHGVQPKLPGAQCFVHPGSGALLAVLPVPHWLDFTRNPTDFTWRWGVFYWDPSMPLSLGNERLCPLVNVTANFRRPGAGEHWSAHKPESLLAAVARYAQSSHTSNGTVATTPLEPSLS